jgi:hypothetical protein
MWYAKFNKSIESGLAKAAQARRTSFPHFAKSALRASPFVRKMFSAHGVSFTELARLEIIVDDLPDSCSAFDGERIVIDRKTVAQGYDAAMPFLIHELMHFLTDKAEDADYFSDPEERRALVWSIAYRLQHGVELDQIDQEFRPLVEPHCDSPSEASLILLRAARRAYKLLGLLKR